MTTMMQWLRPKQNQSKVRFVAMMESGVLIDETADVVQTQVIAQKARASIRNRDAVPIYYQLEGDAPPVWKENAIIETGLAQPPGTQSRHVIEDSHNLWMGYETGTVDSGTGWNLETKHVGLIALGVSVLLFLLFAWLTSLNLSDPAEGTVNGNGSIENAPVSEEEGQGIPENRHGPIQSKVEPAPEAEAGPRPADAAGTAVPDGGRPQGAVTDDSVATGNDRNSP